MPLFEKMNLSKAYSESDLIQFTEKLIDKTNAVHLSSTKNKLKRIQPTWTQQEVFEKVQNGYQNLSSEYPYFTYSYASQKLHYSANP